MPSLPPTSFMALGKILNVSNTQFIYLKVGTILLFDFVVKIKCVIIPVNHAAHNV